MIARFVLAAAVAALVLTTRPVVADDPPRQPDAAKPKPGTLEHTLAALRTPVRYEKDLKNTPLAEILADLGKAYNLRFVFSQEWFKADGRPAIEERKPTVLATSVEGIPLGRFLHVILREIEAAYMVRSGYVEVMPTSRAAEEAKLPPDATGTFWVHKPLVSAIYKEKPLNEAVTDLAEVYDLTVVVSPQAGDNKTAFVSARLLNVPADKALDLIAVQADLRVVRKGNAFLITSIDHANALAEEDFQREMRKIELQKLKNPPPPGLPGGQVPNGVIPFGLNGLGWPLPGGKK